MQVTFYRNFSKRVNETLRPTGGDTLQVRLKEPTDMLNPSFLLDVDVSEYTYCYAFGMYYRITNKVFITNDITEVKCRVDSMATGKDIIANYTCFVERSASNYDILVNDDLLSVQQNIVDRTLSVKSVLASGLNPGFDITGAYVVRCISKSSNNVTGINLYAIDGANLAKILNYAFTDTNYDWFQDVQNDFIKAVFNPFDYIIDLKWTPLDVSTLSGQNNTERIQLGWWLTDAVGYPIKHFGQVFNFSVPLPTPYYTDFRRFNRNYTRISLMIPFVGVIDVDPLEFSEGYLRVLYSIDSVTLQGHCYVEITDSNASLLKYIGYYSANYSANIQLAQSSTDLKRMSADLVASAGNFIAGNYAGSAVGLVDMATVITSPEKTMLGGQQSIVDLKSLTQIQVAVESFGTKDFPTTVAGRPCMRNMRLGDLSGFVKCGNASIATPFLEPINEEINQMLNSGFYFT